jgi:uncharacterized coiled-coil DUF342 family protein
MRGDMEFINKLEIELIKKYQNKLAKMEEEKMSIEQIRQKASEVHMAAKALQRELQTTTDPDERKRMAQQMNELFAQAKSLKEEAKLHYLMNKSIERDFRCLETDLED